MSHGQGQGLVFDGENGAAGSLDLPRIEGDLEDPVASADNVHVLVESLPGCG